MVFAVRNLLGAGAVIAIGVAAAVARMPRRLAPALALAGMVLSLVGYALAASVPAPPYDRAAGSLLAQGWGPEEPVVVFGNLYADRAPLSWYLGQDLTLAETGVGPCRHVFVVSRDAGVNRALRASTPPPATSSVVGGLLVARFDGVEALGGSVLKSGLILVSPESRARCVRALPERLISAKLDARP